MRIKPERLQPLRGHRFRGRISPKPPCLPLRTLSETATAVNFQGCGFSIYRVQPARLHLHLLSMDQWRPQYDQNVRGMDILKRNREDSPHSAETNCSTSLFSEIFVSHLDFKKMKYFGSTQRCDGRMARNIEAGCPQPQHQTLNSKQTIQAQGLKAKIPI